MSDIDTAEAGLRRGMAVATLLALPFWAAVGAVMWGLW